MLCAVTEPVRIRKERKTEECQLKGHGPVVDMDKIFVVAYIVAKLLYVQDDDVRSEEAFCSNGATLTPLGKQHDNVAGWNSP